MMVRLLFLMLALGGCRASIVTEGCSPPLRTSGGPVVVQAGCADTVVIDDISR